MKKQKMYFYIGAFLTGILVLCILVGIFYTPYSPEQMSGGSKFLSPSLIHWMGTDQFGRDVFSRVLKGGGTSLWIALCTVLVGGGIGTILGAVTGYFGGWLDEVLMRVNEVLLVFPSVLLALMFVSVLGPGQNQVILALIISFIPSYTRIVRGEFLNQKNQEYVLNARLQGVSTLRILFVHILPNIKTVLWTSILIGFNNSMLAEAGMSYLGIGVQPPTPSLGRMLSESQGFLKIAPWCALFPGIFMVLLILSFNLLNEGMRRKSR